MSEKRPKTFSEFWPYYVLEHDDLRNRRLHFVGTLLGLICLAAAIARREPLWLLGLPLAGYSFAWFGHFFVEGNQPATFKHPFLSLAADYKMFALMLGGRMEAEIENARARLGARRL